MSSLENREYRLVQGRGRALQPEPENLGHLCTILGTCKHTGAVEVFVTSVDPSWSRRDTVDPECLELV